MLTEDNIRIITKLSNALPKMSDMQKGKILGAAEALEEMNKKEKDDCNDEDLQPAM